MPKTRKDMLDHLRTILCDTQEVGFPDDNELLGYLDRASVYYSEQMTAAKDPSMLKACPVVGSMPLPEDFITLAGQHPVSVTGRWMEYYGDTPHAILYYARLPLPSSYEALGVLPYEDGAYIMIIHLASVFALNRNEYDITQDTTLIQAWRDSMKEARS